MKYTCSSGTCYDKGSFLYILRRQVSISAVGGRARGRVSRGSSVMAEMVAAVTTKTHSNEYFVPPDWALRIKLCLFP